MALEIDIWEILQGIKLTQTQLYMLQLLEDGEEHTEEEMRGCMPLSDSHLGSHVFNLKQRIKERGFHVVVKVRPTVYRLTMEFTKTTKD